MEHSGNFFQTEGDVYRICVLMADQWHARVFGRSSEILHPVEEFYAINIHSKSAEEPVVFARILAVWMESAFISGKFERLVLAGPPEFLQELKNILPVNVLKCIIAELDPGQFATNGGGLDEKLKEILPDYDLSPQP